MTIQMKMNKKGELDMFEFVLISLLILLIIVSGIIMFQESKINYKMPNGIICNKTTYGSSITFYSCSDNQKYINPEYYKEIKK